MVALVNIVLEGPSIKDQIWEYSTQAALSIVHILKYNSVKHMRTDAGRHKLICQTQYGPRNTSSNLHWANAACKKTRKRVLVDRLFNFGLNISYDRVLRL